METKLVEELKHLERHSSFRSLSYDNIEVRTEISTSSLHIFLKDDLEICEGEVRVIHEENSVSEICWISEDLASSESEVKDFLIEHYPDIFAHDYSDLLSTHTL